MSKINLGAKYYRYIDDDIEIIRILSDKDPNGIKYSIGDSILRKRMTLKDLEDNYLRLAPDAYIYINIAKVQELEDVIVTMFRPADIEAGDQIPYCVCRQSITDLFANTINPNYDNLICGVSVSKDTIPDGVTMEPILSCDEITKTIGFCAYIDDTLDKVLKLFRAKDYDNIIYNLFVDHVKYKYKDNAKEYMNKLYVDGYCKTLKGLLLSNNFMYDFYMGLKVFPMDIKIEPHELEKGLGAGHKVLLSEVILKNINNTLVIPYNKFIDLNRIERDYVLIQDSSNSIFIIAYTHRGQYMVSVANIESEENIQKLSKINGYSNSASIRSAMKFNKDKYQQ